MRLLVLIPLALLATDVLAQGRGGRGGDPWQRLERMDADGDGKVSKDEFEGPDRFWDRLDADSDGFVTKDEAQNMRRGNRQRGMGGGGNPGGFLMPAFDKDGDGKISSEEWQAFFKRADKNNDGTVSSDELMQALRGASSSDRRGQDRRGMDRAPKEETAAPKVSAAAFAGGATIDLAKPKRTTVLVFGSYT